MPLVHFNDELEQKLIELWGEQQRRKGGQMIKRKVREMEVVQALNKYAVQLYGEKNEHEFSLKVVSNKINNLKSKARDFYKKYTASTQTGAAVGDGCGGNAGSLDLAAAGAKWGNFKLWHKTFSDVPGYGPISSLSSTQVLSVPASPVRP
eukprot:scpid95198/ scgid5362/ 